MSLVLQKSISAEAVGLGAHHIYILGAYRILYITLLYMYICAVQKAYKTVTD